MKNRKLLPCPFCGGEPDLILIGNDHTKTRSVEIKCTKCFSRQITSAIKFNHKWCENTAIEKWNNRISSAVKPDREKSRESTNTLAREFLKKQGIESGTYITTHMVKCLLKDFLDEYLQSSPEPKEKPDGWISVKDRLPKDNIVVLDTNSDKIYYSGVKHHKYAGANTWYFITEDDDIVTIEAPTHWRPLPAPPTVKEPEKKEL